MFKDASIVVKLWLQTAGLISHLLNQVLNNAEEIVNLQSFFNHSNMSFYLATHVTSGE